MKWFTEVDAGRSPQMISYRDRVLFLGSCFADEISSRMERYGFEVLANPFGVLYNPLSISNSLIRLFDSTPIDEGDVVMDGSVYKSIYHSSDYASADIHSLINNTTDSLINASEFLRKTDTVSLTFGTSWVYRRKSDRRVVSNCHKQPGDSFERFSLTVDEIVAQIAPLIERGGTRRWFLSVSPVRHFKDGAVENMLSKSRLLSAVNELTKIFGNVVYFPSYEIVMDELRDYRFYGPDLVHLSAGAADYIWERFADFALNSESKELLRDYKRLYEMKSHRPLFPESPEYKGLLKRIEELESMLKKKRE